MYYMVEWIHNSPTEPVRMYYELDEKRYELRKVEIFADGSTQFADAQHGSDEVELSWEAHPPHEEIARDPEFRLHMISEEDFEAVWSKVVE